VSGKSYSLHIIGIRNWHKVARDLKEWRTVLEANVLNGLYSLMRRKRRRRVRRKSSRRRY
jgi:hypothetical protein